MPRINHLRSLPFSVLILACAISWVSPASRLRAEPRDAVQANDACAFIPKAELESLVGRELRDGVKKDVAPPQSQCAFQTPPDAYVKKKFDNPALPSASGFDSLTVTTFQTTVATFANSRKTMGNGSPNIPGVGDEAFLSGPAMIFVRVGTRGFSIRVYVNEPTTDAGKTRLREVMLTLGRAGAAKLK